MDAIKTARQDFEEKYSKKPDFLSQPKEIQDKAIASIGNKIFLRTLSIRQKYRGMNNFEAKLELKTNDRHQSVCTL